MRKLWIQCPYLYNMKVAWKYLLYFIYFMNWKSNALLKLIPWPSLANIRIVLNPKRLTAPKARDNIVCILTGPWSTLVIIPLFPINWLPATDQNLTCFTPTLTNCVSESGRNSARNMRWVWPWVEAIFEPENIVKKCLEI